MLIVVPRFQIDVERLIGFAILHCVIHEVEDDILKVHLVDIDCGVYRTDLSIDFSAGVLNSQLE